VEEVISITDNAVTRIVVIFAIEHTLLQISKDALEKVQTKIRKEYNCSLAECYDHPEYLNRVLKDLFGASHTEVVRSVSNYLNDFTYQRPIVEFLDKIKC